MAISAIRLRSTIPTITDNFHQTLDDFEAEIVSGILKPLAV